jgi:hypothetical protein
VRYNFLSVSGAFDKVLRDVAVNYNDGHGLKRYKRKHINRSTQYENNAFELVIRPLGRINVERLFYPRVYYPRTFNRTGCGGKQS